MDQKEKPPRSTASYTFVDRELQNDDIKSTSKEPSQANKHFSSNASEEVLSCRSLRPHTKKEDEKCLGECKRKIRELETNNQRLRSEAVKHRQELAEKVKTNETLMEKFRSADQQKDKLVTQAIDKEAKILQMNEKIISLEREMQSLSTINHTQTENIRKQTEELEMLKCKQKIQVQLLCDHDVNLATAVYEALAKQIGDRMNSGKLEVEIIQCMKASEVQPDLPLLLLICINSHCHRANLPQTLKTMNVGANNAVVIVHLKDPHALPQEASERVLVDIMKRYPSLGGMFDIAFSSHEKEIYKVEMNEKNIISISNFIQRVGVRKRATLLE